MVEISEIVDEKSLEAWLEDLPRTTKAETREAKRLATALSHRAAMRVLPWLWHFCLEPSSLKSGLHLHRYLLMSLHTMLHLSSFEGSAFEMVGEIPDARLLVANGSSASILGTLAANPEVMAAVLSCVTTFEISRKRQADLEGAVSAIVDSAFSPPDSWGYIRSDLLHFDSKPINEPIPLWHGAENPLADLWSTLRPEILAQGDDWQFWVDWYDKALNGDPQDWDLLTKIALVDPKDWDNPDPNHVNGIIADLVKKQGETPSQTLTISGEARMGEMPDFDGSDLRPAKPQITGVERSHINLVLATIEPSRQSAMQLSKQFDAMVAAYLKEIGQPNETPPELEPFVVLSVTFHEIAALLDKLSVGQLSLDEKDKQIAELMAKIEVLESQNEALLASMRSSFFRDTMSSAIGGALASGFIMAAGFIGGQAFAPGVEALSQLSVSQTHIERSMIESEHIIKK